MCKWSRSTIPTRKDQLKDKFLHKTRLIGRSSVNIQMIRRLISTGATSKRAKAKEGRMERKPRW